MLLLGLGGLTLLTGCHKPTPAGYWEGKVTSSEVPMKDQFRTLTRGVNAEFWFVVDWSKDEHIGIVTGEAEADYDCVLKVENLPKITAPVPGGSVKFEPEVGGKLDDMDRHRRFPIVGVLTLQGDTGTLVLQKVDVEDKRTDAQKKDDQASGKPGPDQPMQFTIRADPGVSGGFEGSAGSVKYSNGKVTAGTAGGGEFSKNVNPPDTDLTVIQIPMTPFSPFNDSPAKVDKRTGGPYEATFEEKGKNYSIVWSAKQMGGEQHEAPQITPEMKKQIEDLKKLLQSKH